MRLIDADDLDNVVLRLNEEGRTVTRSEYKTVDSIIFEFPTIEAELVRRGRWKRTNAYSNIIFCDECGEPFEKSNVSDKWNCNSSDKWNYCPNCGARMEEQEGD